jgi:coproporphyrinogen III oxidase-like Fe-S oxidoreductase
MVLKNPRLYVERVRAGAPLVAMEETIDPALAMAETMLLGLAWPGISPAAFATRHGRPVEAVYARELADLSVAGCSPATATAWPPAHRFVLDGIVARFLPDAVGAI